MLILVNPTHRNLSSDPEYRGVRFPFIGIRQFWRVLADGGLIDKKVAYGLTSRKDWNEGCTEQVKRELVGNGLFLTNIVKCCYDHSSYPDGDVIKDQMEVLAEEIRIVSPESIIAFGGLVYKTLTGKNIKLSEYWNGGMTEGNREVISGSGVVTEPCYFPIGRGNPRKAAEILSKIRAASHGRRGLHER